MVRVGAMVEDGRFRVEKFKGQKYQLWKMKMEYYMYKKDDVAAFRQAIPGLVNLLRSGTPAAKEQVCI